MDKLKSDCDVGGDGGDVVFDSPLSIGDASRLRINIKYILDYVGLTYIKTPVNIRNLTCSQLDINILLEAKI